MATRAAASQRFRRSVPPRPVYAFGRGWTGRVPGTGTRPAAAPALPAGRAPGLGVRRGARHNTPAAPARHVRFRPRLAGDPEAAARRLSGHGPVTPVRGQRPHTTRRRNRRATDPASAPAPAARTSMAAASTGRWTCRRRPNQTPRARPASRCRPWRASPAAATATARTRGLAGWVAGCTDAVDLPLGTAPAYVRPSGGVTRARRAAGTPSPYRTGRRASWPPWSSRCCCT